MDGQESCKFCKLSLSLFLWNTLSLYPHANMIHVYLLSNYKLLALTLLERMLSHWQESNIRPDCGLDPRL